MNGRLEENHKRQRALEKPSQNLPIKRAFLFQDLHRRSSLSVTSVMIWYACADSLARMPLECSRT
jgi:hypothetical protein